MEKTNFNPLDFSSKKILVTGATSGIGRATAIYLSKLGAQVVITGRNPERLDETLQQLEGRNHSKVIADLTDLDKIGSLFDQAVEDGAKLNGLVHCAGGIYIMPLKSLTPRRLVDAFYMNYFPFVELCRQYSNGKYSNHGSIVAISSIAAVQADKCQTAYSATKAAMDISAQALSLELFKKGIRINTVLPGLIQTELLQKAEAFGADESLTGSRQLMGRGEPEDVAAACAFLISDMSKFMTGRSLMVDGGTFL